MVVVSSLKKSVQLQVPRDSLLGAFEARSWCPTALQSTLSVVVVVPRRDLLGGIIRYRRVECAYGIPNRVFLKKIFYPLMSASANGSLRVCINFSG